MYSGNLRDIVPIVCIGWGLDKSQIQFNNPAEVIIKLNNSNLVNYINTVVSVDRVNA